MARRTEEGTSRRGRIAAGEMVLRFGSPHGARAERLAGDERPTPKPRPASPPSGPFPDVIDRVEAIERAGTALVAARPVLLHGPTGAGKTTLLRHLSRTAANDAPDGMGAWPDGTILLSARDTSPADLLQRLHAALHVCDTPVHATERQLANGLRDRQALVLVDDHAGSAEDARTILETASACAFAIASEEEVEGLDVLRVPIDALPPDAGVELVARATDREPSPLETARIRELHTTVAGRPLLLLQTAALIHEGAVDPEAAGRLAAEDDPVEALADRLEGILDEAPRRALLVLEAVAPASLSSRDTGAIADRDDPAGALEALAHRGLARVEGARYRAAGGLAARVADRHDPDVWRARALDHFSAILGGGADDAGEEERTTGVDAGALRWALAHALESSRWAAAAVVGRAVERALALQGRWDAWKEAIEGVLEAARALGDRSGEAWALHQLGTRALALGDEERAAADLERAIGIREALGHDGAADHSRRNLALLSEDPAPGRRRRGRARSAIRGAAIVTALVVVATTVFLLVRDGGEAPIPVESEEVVPVETEVVAPGGAGLHASAERIDFGVVSSGTRSAPRSVAIENRGGGPIRDVAARLGGLDAAVFTIVDDRCADRALPVGESCAVEVAFEPTEAGGWSARLVVGDPGAGGVEVALEGTGG